MLNIEKVKISLRLEKVFVFHDGGVDFEPLQDVLKHILKEKGLLEGEAGFKYTDMVTVLNGLINNPELFQPHVESYLAAKEEANV